MLKRLLLAAVVAVVVTFDGRAAELTAIPRVLTKEPTYQGRPRYCLLVFGPEAKARIWLVRDERHLYVDRAGTGDLTTPEARAAVDSNHFTIPHIGAPGGSRQNLTLSSVGDQFRLTLGRRGD